MTITIPFDVVGHDRGGSRAVKDVGKAVDETGKKLTGFSSTTVRSFAVAGAAAVTLGVTSVKAFAEAEQSQLKLEDAFRRFPKLADVNIDAMRDLNSEMMRKTRFDDDALASGQAVLAQFELTGTQIMELTPLLADYAAKTGKDIPTAAETLGKAFLGNTRALKELGISYKATGDQAADTAAITQLLRDKVGGFAEQEGQTAAGQMEILKNKIGEIQEVIGGAILGVIKFAEEHKQVAIALGVAAGAVLTVNLAVKAYKATVEAVNIVQLAFTKSAERFGKMGNFAKGLTLGLGALGLAFGAVALVMSLFNDKADEAKATGGQLADTFDDATGAITDNTRALALNKLEEEGVADMADGMGLSVNTLIDAYLGNADALDLVRQKANELTIAGSPLAARFSHLWQVLHLGNAAMREGEERHGRSKEAAEEHAGAQEHLGGAAGGVADAFIRQATAVEQVLTAREKLFQGAFNLRDAERGFQEAIDKATESLKQNGPTLDITTEKGRENAESLDNIAKKAVEVVKGMQAQGAGTRTLQTTMANGRAEFVRVATQMGMTRVEADRLADQLGLIPGNYRARVEMDASGFHEVGRGVFAALSRLARGVTVPIGGRAGSGLFRAAGGPVAARHGYIVGESGPEWFVPKVAGHIVPNAHLFRGRSHGSQTMGGTGSYAFHFFGPVGSRHELMNWLTRALDDLRRRGRIA